MRSDLSGSSCTCVKAGPTMDQPSSAGGRTPSEGGVRSDGPVTPVRAAGSATVTDRFLAHSSQQAELGAAGAELLPVRLARACAAVLGVDGAGLSVLSGAFRVPLGASDDVAALAERLQFTQGEGPCLDAAATGRPSVTVEAEVHRRWPMFAQELVTYTPYRAVLAVPLMMAPATPGALDLFLRDAAGATQARMDDAMTLRAAIVDALNASRLTDAGRVSRWGEHPQPAWLHGPAATDRTVVWVAVGMVMTEHHATSTDALALLRAHAYSHDTTLDAAADALVNGTLTLSELQL